MRQGRRQRDAVASCVVIMVAVLGNPVAVCAEPAAAAASPAGAASGVPYWQAPALPTTVIQSGPIPPGWQPQAVAYQGMGADGRPVTMYFAPTYVFTYQSGPPVPGTPVIGRPQAWNAAPAAAGGWNYRTSGAQPVPVTLPAPTVARHQPAP